MNDASVSLFRRNVRQLHRLGPRPVGQLLGEVIAKLPEAEPVIADRLAAYADMDAEVVARLGGGDWLQPRQLIRAVAGGEL